eukprot:CAMPEP_0179375202 /NCGR_PEP_ID=MMETSP0797-20121207/87686_1 /TAXON_ID=47934 /ORGANISM="Dinophysis acuminata, Strain DAEP01" /LENGTH=144 /DNA_ID=CAMNT_0021091211 /DNA_START=206 /DNA_END=636 /DNA_ORIENTATION=-
MSQGSSGAASWHLPTLPQGRRAGVDDRRRRVAPGRDALPQLLALHHPQPDLQVPTGAIVFVVVRALHADSVNRGIPGGQQVFTIEGRLHVACRAEAHPMRGRRAPPRAFSKAPGKARGTRGIGRPGGAGAGGGGAGPEPVRLNP